MDNYIRFDWASNVLSQVSHVLESQEQQKKLFTVHQQYVIRYIT